MPYTYEPSAQFKDDDFREEYDRESNVMRLFMDKYNETGERLEEYQGKGEKLIMTIIKGSIFMCKLLAECGVKITGAILMSLVVLEY